MNLMQTSLVGLAVASGAAALFLVALRAFAHCDTMDGPVVADARTALAKGDVTPVLKWVKKDQEADIRAGFAKALAVRAKSAEAKDLADMYFFETLVRVHRAGEGAPYTGLKPAGTPLEPGVGEADKAIESGSVDALVKMTADAVAAGIRHRFEKVGEAKKHKDNSVEAGRGYVEAYVEFVHYIERLHADAASEAGHGEAAEAHAAHAHEK